MEGLGGFLFWSFPYVADTSTCTVVTCVKPVLCTEYPCSDSHASTYLVIYPHCHTSAPRHLSSTLLLLFALGEGL